MKLGKIIIDPHALANVGFGSQAAVRPLGSSDPVLLRSPSRPNGVMIRTLGTKAPVKTLEA
jgi:hypothetical protein